MKKSNNLFILKRRQIKGDVLLMHKIALKVILKKSDFQSVIFEIIFVTHINYSEAFTERKWERNTA